MSKTLLRTIISGMLIFVVNMVYAQYQYPKTRTVDVSDTYFGVTYKDPYRWMENLKDEEVVGWFQQQANFTDDILNKLSGRDELIQEWERLDKLHPPIIRGRNYYGERLFYNKTMPGENVAKFYYRQGMNGEEILLFDPTTHIPGKTLSIQSTLPSHDGKKVLIAYSEGGAEVNTIKIMDVDTRTFLPETIYPSWFSPFSWTFDNEAFTYFSQKTEDHTNPDFILNTKTKLHRLGEDVSKDKDFFSNESYPELQIQPQELPFAFLNKDSRKYIFAEVSTVQNEMLRYYASIDQLDSKINWKVLCKQEDQLVRGMEIIGDEVYAITHKDAKNYKLVHTTLQNPDWENAQVIIPEKPNETLERLTFSKDYLVATYSDGINCRLYKYHFKTQKINEVKLPYTGTVLAFCLDNRINTCHVIITTWNKPITEFEVNLDNEVFKPSSLNPPAVYPKEYEDLMVEEVEVKGHDGAMIPLSIIYKKGIKLDGNNVCLMEGYGAYGYSIPPYFDNMYNSMVIKNDIVVAIPHVRGGSEKGEAWYKAGFKTTKPNTWKDFISCAEYLVAKGYTSAAKLAGKGTSAGGILITRAITERPDLFAAAICNVGCANAMRMEFSPSGPNNTSEFGTITDSIECRALYEMDGLQHVVQNTRYPAVLSVAGWNDPRVIPWQPGKFAAAMQQASASGKPVLLKVNYDNGHFTEEKKVTFANFADQYAFAMWQCGHPEFQE